MIHRAETSRAVFGLAWPVMLSMGLGTLYTLVDAFWIGRLGATALAAVTPAQFASWVLWSLGAVLSMGVPALVSQAVGANDQGRARLGATGGVQLAVTMGLLVALLSRPFTAGVFEVVETTDTLRDIGAGYLHVLLLGSGAIFVFMALEAILRAAGDTRTPMLFRTGALLLNGILDPFLILGIGPFPAWGVTGAAVATVAAETVGVLAYVAYFLSGRGRIRVFSRELLVLHPGVWRRILRIGLPGGLNAGLFTVVYILLSRVAATMGEVPLAVLGVGNRLESISYLIATGFEVAAMTLVGQRMGAGRHHDAEAAAWVATVQAALFTGVMGVVFWTLPAPLFGLFTDDPTTVAEGVRFLRIIAWCQLWMGVEIAIFGGFTGAGNTGPPVWISSTISLLRVPLAFLSAHLGWGPTGLWWVISATCAVRGVLLALWFRRGRWKAARVW